MLPQPPQSRKNLCNLLGYAEEILKASERVISDLSRDALASFHEHDVVGLEGVIIPSSDIEGGWLRVTRLHEIEAPKPENTYLLWLSPLRQGEGPFEVPRLVETRLVSVPVEDASDLIEAGIAAEDDIMRPKGTSAGRDDIIDVLLRLKNMPEFKSNFDDWLTGTWEAWESIERPRRRSIAFYNRLFEIQQRSASMGDDTPVETVFGIGLARWAHPTGRINAPLIEAAVELELESEDGTITIRPRPHPPQLALRPFDELEIAGVGKLQREATEQLERFYGDPDVGFSPHEPFSFEPVLRMCHARLASDAVYEPDNPIREDRSPPAIDGKLRITDGWVLYVRQRSANFRCEDIRRLKDAIEKAEDTSLPAPALQMTSQPSNASVDEDIVDLGSAVIHFPEAPDVGAHPPAGGGKAGTNEEECSYFFPLPYNDDQIEIVRRLERDDVCGVVVQGPPGTGKTHTIANIIAHYMAKGRRVLVSAHEPEALAAIQGKLPESIRDLAISVIHSDREGARRLEQAIDILASQVKLIDKRAHNEQRIDLEKQLAKNRRELIEIDENIREYARLNLTLFDFKGEKLLPMELAAKVEAERSLHSWFQDQIGRGPRFNLRFTATDINEAKSIRRELGRDLHYSSGDLPDPTTLPDVASLLSAHAALTRENLANVRTASGDLPYVSFSPSAGLEEATSLKEWLDNMAGWLEAIKQNDLWLTEVYRLLLGVRIVHETLRVRIRALCEEWIDLSIEGREFMLRGVALPGVAFPDEVFDAAVDAFADGRKPFGMFTFGKSATKALLESVKVDGAPPDGPRGWSCVRDYRAWQRRALSFFGKWSTVAGATGLPAILGEWEAASTELVRIGDLVERMHRLHLSAPSHFDTVVALFPYGVDAKQVVFQMELTVAREALAANLEKEGHADAHRIKRNLEEISRSGDRPFYAAVGQIFTSLGDPEVAPQDLAEGWRETLSEALRLDRLRERRQRLETISAAISASGAPIWAAALLSDAVNGEDIWTPESWQLSWEWARADGHVKRLSDRSALTVLSARRNELEGRQRTFMTEIVRIRTFIGLKQGITERVASALQKFAMKVRQLGSGTGKSAERHRRGIREATLEAAVAVPCWILPEWRVAEQLPSDLAAFDLVIIDEASQSDITSLPAVLRGKKLLIVGDDKQVSPSAVGMEERTVVQLRETFLRGMDIANFLEPTTSLYDLASMTFPGSIIMLKEHFRCVEPIIAFSSRFYPKALIPLRVPTAEERLEPPLVDVYLPEGRKVRDVNVAEADFIVGEIARLVAMPEFAHRTFGVISMIGDKQAKLIQDRLIEEVGTEALSRHHIACGNASKFQGQERDIIFLSLVSCPKTARAQTARLIEQRFNVAMSRARDRMYLVRSVAASMLSPNDLKSAVIEHFRNPMISTAVARDKVVLAETESSFERDVGELLLERGYRLRPQVQVGGYRIDFVVEGEGDRRLALELDGDRYHGPERWFEDVHRQRALERLGWTFWRCWGSHWLADRQGCLDDLLTVLARLGIEPVGGEVSAQVWTEHRIVGKDQGVAELAQTIAAETSRPVLATVNEGADLFTIPTAQRQTDLFTTTTTQEQTEGEIVEVGDTVIVRFADDNHVRRFKLSRDTHNPESGVVGVGQPIVEALLGNGVEEEVNLVVGGRERRVIIEKITKAA